MRINIVLCLLLIGTIAHSQPLDPPGATSFNDRWDAYQKRQALSETSLIRNLKFDNIGPTVMSGRVTDIEVNPSDPTQFYVAYASGGLWYTGNNGTSFTPIFDHEAVMTIGDIAVDWNDGTIWVGTGENNSSRSSYAGLGMYKSADRGETWEFMGLPESHHIGRIIIHPEDPQTLIVAVLGRLYSESTDRGVYMTNDGGTTWTQTLFVNDDCGAVDLCMDPSNPDVIYAAMWERNRRAWNFTESGSGSGIYRSSDGGITWSLITGEDSGFPHGEGTGRIGLDIVENNDRLVIAAIVDNYFRREKEEEEDITALTRDRLRTMSTQEFLEVDEEAIKTFLEDNNFPEEYNVKTVRSMVKDSTIEPLALVEYLEDANSLLFDTDVIGAEVYLSDDNGQTWRKSHEGFIDRLYNTYGYYFGQIRLSPRDPQKMYILGVPILRSDDGGANWKSIDGDNMHADHHSLWVSEARDGHLINGNDGGINISYDDGETWVKCNSPSVGQFYYVTLDRQKPYHVYGGLQDNGVWGGPHTYRGGTRWHNTGQYPYKSYLGGDGMQVQIDYRDNNTMYCGLQFGNYFRVDMTSGQRKFITPRHKLGERPLRWNWQTPILISRHQQDIIYMGSNLLHRSFDQGDNFEVISPDLTHGGLKGDVPYGTLTTIHESPLKFGLIYTGSDDGRVHVTRDMGNSWTDISDGLPEDLWVSRVWASSHFEGRVYCSLNGYRWDNFKSYLYVSDDFGSLWRSIGDALPDEAVNVIKEDPQDPDILYVGTDHGVYISLDQGRSFHGTGDAVPAVAVHDLAIHPEENDLVLGTHGRSIFIADIGPLRGIKGHESEVVILFEPNPSSLRYSRRWGNRGADWAEYFTPEMVFPYYSAEGGEISWEVVHDDIVLATGIKESDIGLNYMEYDLSLSVEGKDVYLQKLREEDAEAEIEQADNGKFYLPTGTYELRLSKDGHMNGITFEVK